MLTSSVLACDWLGEMPDQDAGAEPVLRITTNLPAGGDNTFYMDVVDPRPQPGDPISFEIPHGFLGSEHEVEWRGQRIRQRGYAFDWIGAAPATSTREFSLLPSTPDTSILGKLGMD